MQMFCRVLRSPKVLSQRSYLSCLRLAAWFLRWAVLGECSAVFGSLGEILGLLWNVKNTPKKNSKPDRKRCL